MGPTNDYATVLAYLRKTNVWQTTEQIAVGTGLLRAYLASLLVTLNQAGLIDEHPDQKGAPGQGRIWQAVANPKPLSVRERNRRGYVREAGGHASWTEYQVIGRAGRVVSRWDLPHQAQHAIDKLEGRS